MTSVVIPEKLFFKIGEVCELAGVQAHVLRYWETEFPMFAPQKNRAGQRTYRRRDVEMALRIKQLLYDEQYTIAGARKKLASDPRGLSRDNSQTGQHRPMRSLKPPPSLAAKFGTATAPAEATSESVDEPQSEPTPSVNAGERAALKEIFQELREVLDLLDQGDAAIREARAKLE